MGRLRLAIIDNDRNYMESMAGYMTLNYGLSFNVSCFTKIEAFLNETDESPAKYDIVLVSPALYNQGGLSQFPGTVIFLEDQAVCSKKDIPSIFKYRHCDSIISEMLDILDARGYPCCILKGGTNGARVVGVYSPVGGSGKSTVAVGLSIQCVGRGKKAFYLNLESAESTLSFFDKREGPDFSRVILSLKYDRDTCARAIMNTRVVSEINGLNYYLPPESSLERDEMTADDYGFLVECIKNSGIYDFVFIDMNSCISRKTLAVLEKCDVILFIAVRGNVAEEKINSFCRELALMDREKRNLLESRIVAIENRRSMGSGHGPGGKVAGGMEISAELPYSRAVEESEGCEIFFNERDVFVEGLREIMCVYVMGKGEKEKAGEI